MRSLHGTHVHGFPDAFFRSADPGANLISNVPHNLVEAGTTIAMVARRAIDQGTRRVEVTEEAESAWISLLMDGGRMIGSPDCTPGYYNNEGVDPGPAARLYVGYPAGPSACFKYLEKWRNRGEFEGLTFQ